MNLESLYRQEWRRVLATTLRLTGDFDLSEEAVQDAFVAALEQWPRDGAPASPYAWLVSTARNRVVDQIRRRARFDESRLKSSGLPAKTLFSIFRRLDHTDAAGVCITQLDRHLGEALQNRAGLSPGGTAPLREFFNQLATQDTSLRGSARDRGLNLPGPVTRGSATLRSWHPDLARNQ
jgi:hypothetical protein